MPAAPARWQSSQRPLFVRTVCVNGIRHAILSADDPLLQYVPLTKASRPSTTSSRSSSQSLSSISNSRRYRIEDCLVKLRSANTIAGGSGYSRASGEDDVDEESVQMREYIDEAEYRIRNSKSTLDAMNCYSDDYSSDNDTALRLPRLSHFIRPLSFYEHHKTGDTSEDVLLPDLHDNPLSERVLQWLDLSGKTKRLHAPIVREMSPSPSPVPAVDPKRQPTSESRRSYSVCKTDIPVRSLSVHIPRNLKVASKHINESSKSRQPVDVTQRLIYETAETRVLKTASYSATLQSYETVASKLRPVTAWPLTSTPPAAESASNRPQLHIFMPPIDNDEANVSRLHDEVSEYESLTSDISK